MTIEELTNEEIWEMYGYNAHIAGFYFENGKRRYMIRKDVKDGYPVYTKEAMECYKRKHPNAIIKNK
jgi:hypothetical protein